MDILGVLITCAVATAILDFPDIVHTIASGVSGVEGVSKSGEIRQDQNSF